MKPKNIRILKSLSAVFLVIALLFSGTNTVYHTRAYAINSEGISYGADRTFTTLTGTHPSDPDTPPTVVTRTVTDVTASGATFSGSVTDDGGEAVTERGFVYGTAANPAIGGAGVTKVAAGSGIGSFTAEISGLSVNMTYHVSAYAVNSEGTSYGRDVDFTTEKNGQDNVPNTGNGGGFSFVAGIAGLTLLAVGGLLIVWRYKNKAA